MEDRLQSNSKNSHTPRQCINGVNFTLREIDILACLLGGRSAKKIASILNLSPRTVENYIRNIMLKIEVNSREAILDFLEKSPEISLLRDQYEHLCKGELPQTNPNIPTSALSSTLFHKHTGQRKVLSVLKRAKKPLLLFGSFSTFLLFGYLTFIYFGNREDTLIWGKKNVVCSNLMLPTETFLLDLPKRIEQLDKKFRGKEKIKTIAILGPGGAGKTTLARQYAQTQKSDVIWEINAETPESLLSSFERLAKKIATTERDQKLLSDIQDLKHVQEREEKVLDFVKKHLRRYSSWVLIYDNVENLFAFQKQLPQDARLWGHGKVILTSRDNHFQNNKYVNGIIRVSMLTSEQKFTLFRKVMAQGGVPISTSYQIQKAREFLENIPPYPLDVTLAAYYLKATHTSYTTYLEKLKKNNEAFTTLQKHLLTASGDYSKTRYGIIIASLKRFLSTHKDFEELLLLISLLDSQKIPRDLLEKCKNNMVVDSFIHGLKRYSLILEESTDHLSLRSALSLHRSTQQESLKFLTKTLALETQQSLIDPIAGDLEDYISDAIEKGDLSLLKLLMGHCNALLKHTSLLTPLTKAAIQGKLGGIYFHLGYYGKAKQFLEVSLSGLRAQNGNEQVRLGWTLARLGNVHEKQGNYESAKELFEQSLSVYKNLFSDNHPDVPYVLTYLGGIYRSLGDYEKAIFLLKKSLSIYEKHFPTNYAGKARVFVYLGSIYRKRGDFEKSKEFLEKSLNIYKKHFTIDHADTTWAAVSLASTYRNLGEYKKSEVLLKQSLSYYKKHFSENHIRIATISGYLGLTHHSLGNYDLAKHYLEKSLAIYKKTYPDNYMDIAWTLGNLGMVHKSLGNYKQATSFLEQSIHLYNEHYTKVNIRTAWVLLYLGEVYLALGDYDKAQTLFNQVIEAHQKKLGPGNIRTAWSLIQLGVLHLELGNYKQAKEILERTFAIHRENYPDTHPDIALIARYLGSVYRYLGETTKAKESLALSFKSTLNNFGQDHLETAKVLIDVGKLNILESHFKEGDSYFETALDILHRHNHPDQYKALESLADSKNLQGLPKKALAVLSQALEIVVANFPENSPHIERLQAKINAVN